MFTIFIPIHNNAEKIEADVYKICSALRKGFREQWQIFVLDRGSTDNSAEVLKRVCAKEKRVKLVSARKRLGFGLALKRSLDTAKGEVIVMEPEMSENSGRLKEVIVLLRDKTTGPDIVNGSRFMKGAVYTSMFPRRMLSRFYNFLVNLVFLTKLSDFQCEFRGFREDVFKHLCFAAKSNSRFWLTESLVRARKMDYIIKEMPVYYNKQWRVHLKNFILRIKNVLRLKKEI